MMILLTFPIPTLNCNYKLMLRGWSHHVKPRHAVYGHKTRTGGNDLQHNQLRQSSLIQR